jgi:hypothetical protein
VLIISSQAGYGNEKQLPVQSWSGRKKNNHRSQGSKKILPAQPWKSGDFIAA